MTLDVVDPAAAPNPYRELILGALGDRDPVAVQQSTPAEMRRLIADAGHHLRQQPEASEWSVLQLIGHLADAELIVSTRYRFILAQERPPIQPYDQDLWAKHLRHNNAEPDHLLLAFEALRDANVALWRATPAEARARYGIHAERGPETYEVTFRLAAGHDIVHLDQARRTLEAVRAG